MSIDLVKTKNPFRRLMTGTWYIAVNEKGEKLLWVPYTSFLCGKMSVEGWLDILSTSDIEPNIQLAFDRWNFGPGNKFDYEMLRVLQIIEQGQQPRPSGDPFLNEPIYDMPWTTPLGIARNISFYGTCGVLISIAWCIDLIIRWSPNWVDEFLRKSFEKMLGKF